MKYTSLNENLKFSRIIAGCMRTLDAGMDGNKLRNFVHNCMDLVMRFLEKSQNFVLR